MQSAAKIGWEVDGFEVCPKKGLLRQVRGHAREGETPWGERDFLDYKERPRVSRVARLGLCYWPSVGRRGNIVAFEGLGHREQNTGTLVLIRLFVVESALCS